MDNLGNDQHPDAVAEVGQRWGQGLAVLATLGEAAARLAAEQTRRRQLREERSEMAQRADELTRQAQWRRAAQHDRRVIAAGLDSDWLDRAGLLELARVWRTARARERQFPEAGSVARDVEMQLREMYPRPMDLYDQAVANGASRAAAMRVAAEEMAHTPVMRAHGGRNSAPITAAAPVVGAEVFEAAVQQQRAALLDGVDVAACTDELERLGVGGSAAVQALREVLAARAGQELRQGRMDAATPDDPNTADVDERTAQGMPASGGDIADANRDVGTAAKLVAQWYPEGINRPSTTPRQVPARQPGNGPTEAVGRTVTRTR